MSPTVSRTSCFIASIAADVGERREVVGRLYLEVAALATHTAADSATEQRCQRVGRRRGARPRATTAGALRARRPPGGCLPVGGRRSAVRLRRRHDVAHVHPFTGTRVVPYERVQGPSIICSN